MANTEDARAIALSMRSLADRLLSDWLDMGQLLADGPFLQIFNSEEFAPDFGPLHERCGGLDLRIETDARDTMLQWGEVPVARVSSDSLPLHSDRFAAVVLCHVVARGDEDVFEEACRALQPDGRLFILGLNRLGARYLAGRSRHGLPGISPLAVRNRLEDLDMQVCGLYAAGFWQSEKPRQMNRGLARALVPLADLFLLVAQPVEPEIMNPIQSSELRAVGAPSALAGP